MKELENLFKGVKVRHELFEHATITIHINQRLEVLELIKKHGWRINGELPDGQQGYSQIIASRKIAKPEGDRKSGTVS